MTTKAGAIHQWMQGFGIPAYTFTSVPEDAKMPYITYELYTGAWGDGEQNIQMSVWFRGESEAKPNAKVEEISKAIGLDGVLVRCDGGAIWIKRGSPFSMTVSDTDASVKRRIVNVSVEFFTTS